MLLQFKAYIEKKKLFTPDDTILLGLSGGIDSRVLFDLFIKAGYKIGVAHCNFGLRGEESDVDEMFVQNLAQEYNLPFHKIHFNTTEYAELQKISIQMAARELRYNWFENVRRNYNYSYIAIAHNSDDALETFFINLSRGTGIKGISGIKSKNNYIVRPLLFADRASIEQYCVNNNLEYREDSSNKTDKYIRNDIRHNLIPLLNNILPDFKKVMTDNFEKFNEAAKIYEFGIKSLSKQLLRIENECIYINIAQLIETDAIGTVLHELLKPYNFSVKTIEEIAGSINAPSGTQFFSESHRLIINRDELIVSEFKADDVNKHYIEEDIEELIEPIHLTFSTYDSDNYEIKRDINIAALDADLLTFPLIIRKWSKGDYFQPLGMNGMKKLSDFFIDNKLSIVEKENTWLIASGDQIVWIVGKRIDDRFKITPQTLRIMEINLI